jgi:hypothetical protein
VLASCVVYQNTGDMAFPQCGIPGQTPDEDRCVCNADCETASQGTLCWDEPTTGTPGGMCAHPCTTSQDCDAGFLCAYQYCLRQCVTTPDCGPGRACMDLRTNGPRVCFEYCEAPADCRSGRCNPYSGLCLEDGDVITGGGVGAPCSVDKDCRSGACLQHACSSLCDTDAQSCPDGAACISSLCRVPCHSDTDCAGLGVPSCSDFGMDSFCT